jgi:hypothetical protein
VPVYLYGISAKYFRGIGQDRQYIYPFADVNMLIGPNNSGKSAVLELIRSHLPFREGDQGTTTPLSADAYIGPETGPMSVTVGVPKEVVARAIHERLADQLRNDLDEPRLVRTVDVILENLSQFGMIWASPSEIEAPGDADTALRARQEGWLSDRDWNFVWSRLTGHSRGSLEQHWIPDTISSMRRLARIRYPETLLIPAKRQIGPTGEPLNDLSGRGLIDRLAEMQNPDFDKRSDREKFDRLNDFLRSVLGNSDASIEVPTSRSALQVHIDGKVLPLGRLGTGIHELILLASFCTIHEEKIICLEEPEIHLHPILQRRLITYLQKETRNQYFIATHSPALINTPNTSIFHISNDGSKTTVRSAAKPGDLGSILDSLGYHASDLLQSNSAIWVEGPSDRLYLRHWINQLAPDLKEGIHFSIMFYGGSLIRHLSAGEDTPRDFISLSRLNRNMAIVMDSDRDHPDAALKSTVERLKEEARSRNVLIWITAGREIENYIAPELVHGALRELHPRVYGKPCETGVFDHSFHFVRSDGTGEASAIYRDADKVGVASHVTRHPVNWDRLDLRERVKELVEMIKLANGLS